MTQISQTQIWWFSLLRIFGISSRIQFFRFKVRFLAFSVVKCRRVMVTFVRDGRNKFNNFGDFYN